MERNCLLFLTKHVMGLGISMTPQLWIPLKTKLCFFTGNHYLSATPPLLLHTLFALGHIFLLFPLSVVSNIHSPFWGCNSIWGWFDSGKINNKKSWSFWFGFLGPMAQIVRLSPTTLFLCGSGVNWPEVHWSPS